jgi:hypothetical protein
LENYSFYSPNLKKNRHIVSNRKIDGGYHDPTRICLHEVSQSGELELINIINLHPLKLADHEFFKNINMKTNLLQIKEMDDGSLKLFFGKSSSQRPLSLVGISTLIIGPEGRIQLNSYKHMQLDSIESIPTITKIKQIGSDYIALVCIQKTDNTDPYRTFYRNDPAYAAIFDDELNVLKKIPLVQNCRIFEFNPASNILYFDEDSIEKVVKLTGRRVEKNEESGEYELVEIEGFQEFTDVLDIDMTRPQSYRFVFKGKEVWFFEKLEGKFKFKILNEKLLPLQRKGYFESTQNEGFGFDKFGAFLSTASRYWIENFVFSESGTKAILTFNRLPTGNQRSYTNAVYKFDFENLNIELLFMQEYNKKYMHGGQSRSSEMVCSNFGIMVKEDLDQGVKSTVIEMFRTD